MSTLQQLVVLMVVAWAAWHVYGVLAPWHRRRQRAAMARALVGRAPAWLVAWLRPPVVSTGCGCGTGCSEPARRNHD